MLGLSFNSLGRNSISSDFLGRNSISSDFRGRSFVCSTLHRYVSTFSTKNGYNSTVSTFSTGKTCGFDFVLELKLFLDRGFLVEKLHLLVKKNFGEPGADLGKGVREGVGVRTLLPSEIRPLPSQRVPLCAILTHPFLAD